jgi:mRNA interferase YafQ
MYSINYTHQFKKDMRKCAKRGLDIEEIKTAIKILSETGALPAEYKPHLLKGDRKGQWECHIEPNWLMTWEQNDNELTLLFLQTGTHSDIFGW